MKTPTILLACFAAATLALSGCCSNCDKQCDDKGMKAMNTECPISHEKLEASVVTSEWNGKSVAFCCAGCKGKFDKMSDADKAACMAKCK